MCNGQRFTQSHIQSMWPMAIQQFKNVSTLIFHLQFYFHIWTSLLRTRWNSIPFNFLFKFVQMYKEMLEEVNVRCKMSIAWQQMTIVKRISTLQHTAIAWYQWHLWTYTYFSSCSSHFIKIGLFLYGISRNSLDLLLWKFGGVSVGINRKKIVMKLYHRHFW